MSHARVEIDLNSVRGDGTTRVRLSRADGPLQQGQIVVAYESEDEVAAYGFVDRIDQAAGYAFITVNRASIRDDDGTLDGSFSAAGINPAAARAANVRADRAFATTSAVGSYALRRVLPA